MFYSKAVAVVALLAVMLTPLSITDSSADGGMIKGEGTGEGIAVTYSADPVSYMNLKLDRTPSADISVTILIGDHAQTIEPVRASSDVNVFVEQLSVGRFPVMVTDFSSGSKIAECYLETYVADTVHFSAGQGSGSMDDIYCKPGSSVTLPDSGFKAPEGKAFSDWTSSGKQYSPGETVTVQGDMTFTAQYKESSGEGFPLAIIAGIVVVILVVSGGIIFLLRRQV